MNSINLGNFLGGAASGAMNTFVTLKQLQYQDAQYEQQKLDNEAQKAVTEQIKGITPIGGYYDSAGQVIAAPAVDPSAPTPPPPQSLQPNDASNTTSTGAAYAIPGIADAMTPPAAASAAPAAATALPAGSAPYGIAAPPDPTMPANLPPVVQAPQGAPPVTGVPQGKIRMTPEMHAQQVEDIYNNSGRPNLMKIGQSMTQNRLASKLINLQVKNGEMDMVARQTGQNVMKAYSMYLSNPQGGLDMLNSIGNDGVSNGSRMTQAAADGPNSDGKIVVTHWGPNGKFMGMDPAQTPDHLFMMAATLGDVDKHMAMVKEWSSAQAEAQKGELYAADKDRIRTELALGGPEATIAKLNAESRSLDANTEANVSYKKAEEFKLKLDADRDARKQAYLATYNSTDPSVTYQQKQQARQAFEAEDGKFAGVTYHGTPNGMVFKDDPSNTKYPTTVWSEELQQFLPPGVAGKDIAKESLFKNGSITPAWFANGNYGYVVKGQEINPKTGQPQGADTWQEAVRLFKGDPAPSAAAKSALPKGGKAAARSIARPPANPTGALDPNWRRNATYDNTIGGPDLSGVARAIQGPANWRNPGGAPAQQTSALPQATAQAQPTALPMPIPANQLPLMTGNRAQDLQNRSDYFTLPQHDGMVARGNLDPWHRAILQNPDGTHSTTLSIGIHTDKGETVIPTVVNGVKLTSKEAIAYFQKTGQNFGTFKDEATADKYASDLHDMQERFIQRGR